ncbi:transferase hexapeptide repeat protein, partial [Salmonella enterica]|nr:transferase hexapeptide repeat protein [Salmonella enterica]
VSVGTKSFIGSCTVVNGQLKIGNSSIIGSGSVVIRDIPDNVVVAGSPTKFIRAR